MQEVVNPGALFWGPRLNFAYEELRLKIYTGRDAMFPLGRQRVCGAYIMTDILRSKLLSSAPPSAHTYFASLPGHMIQPPVSDFIFTVGIVGA
jgi:hypothetical protein